MPTYFLISWSHLKFGCLFDTSWISDLYTCGPPVFCSCHYMSIAILEIWFSGLCLIWSLLIIPRIHHSIVVCVTYNVFFIRYSSIHLNVIKFRPNAFHTNLIHFIFLFMKIDSRICISIVLGKFTLLLVPELCCWFLCLWHLTNRYTWPLLMLS